ncbi:Uncharacterised protein [Vibrio cholerae]|nr:Uncharacterised protein [Vibrio cholerae]
MFLSHIAQYRKDHDPSQYGETTVDQHGHKGVVGNIGFLR